MKALTGLLVLLLLSSSCSRSRVATVPAPERTAAAEPNLDLNDETTATTGPVDPALRQRMRYERTLRKYGLSSKGDPARLAEYVQVYIAEFVTDPRMFAFDAKAQQQRDGAVTLTGYAEFKEYRESLERFLKFLGFDSIDNQIEQLPSQSLGETSFAFVAVPSTYLYDKSSTPHRPASQAVLADPIYLLKDTGDGHYLCHSAEGYLGYVAATDVQRVDAKTFHAYQNAPQAYLLQDFKKDGMNLPAGCRLRVTKTSPETITVVTPMGESIALSTKQVEIGDPRPTRHMNSIIETAHRMMGSKYVWGGKSSTGVDCSGLVQTAFKAHGINLPRDADQQVLVGSLVATRYDRAGLRRGDLVFFLSSRGNVHHVGIYLGDKTYLEAAGKEVKITGLFPGSPNYDPKRDESFCFAKRVLE